MKSKTVIIFFSIAAVFCIQACVDMNVPDFNNPSIEDFENNPTRSSFSAVATGLIVGHRRDVATYNGFMVMLGILGREAYNFDTGSDPRFIDETLLGSLSGGSPRFGANFWIQPYANIRNGNVLLDNIDKVPGLSNEEKESARGFTKTMQALDFLVVVNTRDTNPIPIDVGGSHEVLGNLEGKEVVFEHIATLLDEAKTHLLAGGDEFAFPLSTGFSGFDTPETFLEFNRAVKARVEVYRGNFDDALTALDESFISDDINDPMFDLGVYHVFSTGTGDALNDLLNPNIYAHPSILSDGESGDARLAKVTTAAKPGSTMGFSSNLQFTLYPENTSSVPIIRNEELILLRAEANLGLENYLEAAEDINFIRVYSGELAERNDLDESNILDELLHQKRYSLLFEGGHRWIDMRRYGRLNETYIPKTYNRPPDTDPSIDEVYNQAYPLPVEETDARE